MSDNVDVNTTRESKIVHGKRMSLSVVWIIPILAAVVAVGIAVQKIMTEGPTITIVFKAAQGVEEGKTFLKYKEVNVGLVKKVELSEDFRKVVVTAKMEKSAAGLLGDDTRFWVEQPRASLSGVSGLGTLLSGNYIGVEPAKTKKQKTSFIGLETPPAVTFDQPGRKFVLHTTTLGSISNGSPLFYRQLNVGQVIGYDLAKDGMTVNVQVFVNEPYDKYVKPGTRFWQAAGIDVSLGAEGFSMHTQSLLSLLIGGIGFETPPSTDEAKPAPENTAFQLFNSRPEAMANPETVLVPYTLHFNESLRGLSVGAPVQYLGLTIGEVTSVGLEYFEEKNEVRPRVDIVVYPQRFRKIVKDSTGMAQNEKSRQDFLQRAVDNGLRAQLRNGNLLTGQLYVAMDVFPGSPRAKINWSKSPTELPVVASGMQDIQAKISTILSRVEKLPLEEIGMNAKKALEDIDKVLKRTDSETLPELKKTLEDLRRVLEGIDTNMTGEDAPTQQQMRELIREATRAAQGVSELTEYLQRSPEALIKGKTQEKP